MSAEPLVSADAGLLRIIAAAASPEERADRTLFVPLAEQPHVAARLDAFVRSSAGGDRVRFERLLHARGLSIETFTRGLADVECTNRLPGWGAMLLEVMDDLAIAEESIGAPAKDAAQPIVAFVRPLLGTAERFVRATAQRTGVLIAEPVVWEVVRILAHRLFGLSADVLETEKRDAALFAQIMQLPPPEEVPSTHASWLQRFERYPVLARLIGVAYCNWQRHVTELFERVAADRALLEERLFGGRCLDALTGFSGDLGDVHDEGRAVAMLTFDDRHVVLYKPKDLRSGAAFLDLLRTLDQGLHVRTMLTRDGYTWDEFVPYEECRTREDVGRFYRRMGMLVRVLQFVNARDFWLDNLIAAGDQPVFVDFEMILQPCIPEQPMLTPAERAARRVIDDSVVCLGAVAFTTPIAEGVKGEDLGALTPVRDFLSPFRMSSSTSASFGLDAGATRNQYVLWQKRDYAPSLEGMPQPAAEWLEEIVAGYRDMHAAILARRDELPLEELASHPVRYIHRDTWSCIKLLQTSVRANLLADPFAREAFLHGLLQHPGANANPGAVGVAESEIRSFRQLDVPLFLSTPASDAVFAPDGTRVEGYFPGLAVDEMRKRVRELDAFDVDLHADLLRSCFATGAHAVRESRPLRAARDVAPPRSEAWLAAAIELGDRIAAEAMVGSGNDGAWIGIVEQPTLAIRAVDVLRPDILTGTCGLAIVFSDLFAVTREERFRSAARMALVATEGVARTAAMMFARTLAGVPGERRMPACGAYLGIGSQLFALLHASRRLESQHYAELAKTYVAALPADALCSEARIDFISGTSGLAVALLPLRDVAAHVIDAALDRIARAHEQQFPGYPDGETDFAGFPSERDGHALALARAGREPVADFASLAGTRPGTLLTRVALGHDVLDEVSRAIEHAASSNDALDAMELAFAAHRRTNDDRFLARAAAHGASLRERGLTHSYAADRHRLSALTGLAAATHHYLRLYAPERVRSIRLLELEGDA